MAHAPPVVKLALAFAVGAGSVLAGAPVALAPLALLLCLVWPIEASARPARRTLWVLAALAGLCSAALGAGEERCAPARVGAQVTLEGRFLASPRTGGAPFLPDSACGPVTVVVTDTSLEAGRPVRLVGQWREGRHRRWFAARATEPLADRSGGGLRWAAVRWRDALVVRLTRLYGDRAPLVTALTLARREGFDPDLREAFARVGIAHLLAISGFHVGVIAGVALTLLRLAGCRPRAAGVGAAAAAWLYVGFIGFPDAACRAALILGLVAVSRARARPTARWGPLGAALLVLIALDPTRLSRVGFQLSFAGAAGLVAWAAPIRRSLRGRGRVRCPAGLAVGIAAGCAATAATLPFVAWHFDRVSLVGVPVTLAATPIVVLALVGSLASLVVDLVSPSLATFLAGGVTPFLLLLEGGARVVADWPWASAWTTRGTVLGATAGVAAAWYAARHPRVRGRGRRVLTATYGLVGVLAWPLLLALQGRGTAEILMIDVGQGDAIALRSPAGRWLLVDAGPPPPDADPGAHPVVRALRARGVRRLEALVLTHPDLDHVGGAAAVLEAFDVGAVYDPALPAGKQAFVEALEVATSRDVPWHAARRGMRIDLDGLAAEVLHPVDVADTGEANAASVVLQSTFGDFDALLTGDAYRDVERTILGAVRTDLEVLKVGHHGSDTSTDSLLLAHASPEIALISVGRNNRYGHPTARVLARLSRSGVRVHRTDREGTISIVARPDGSFRLSSRR